MADKKRTVNLPIGAPSLTGIDANDVAAKEFTAGDFPLAVTFTSRANFSLIIPGKFHLKPLHDTENCHATVEIKSLDSMQRLTSDLESIAENHKVAELVIVEAEVIDNTPVTKKSAKATPEITEGG